MANADIMQIYHSALFLPSVFVEEIHCFTGKHHKRHCYLIHYFESDQTRLRHSFYSLRNCFLKVKKTNRLTFQLEIVAL